MLLKTSEKHTEVTQRMFSFAERLDGARSIRRKGAVSEAQRTVWKVLPYDAESAKVRPNVSQKDSAVPRSLTSWFSREYFVLCFSLSFGFFNQAGLEHKRIFDDDLLEMGYFEGFLLCIP